MEVKVYKKIDKINIGEEIGTKSIHVMISSKDEKEKKIIESIDLETLKKYISFALNIAKYCP